MKLKLELEDFVVEEVIDLEFRSSGPYKVYKLTKSGVESLKLFPQIAQRCNIKPTDIGYCGVKDKHAVSTQYITLASNIDLPHMNGCEVEEVGFLDKHLGRGDLKGNKFKILVRDVTSEELEKFNVNVLQIQKLGFINYFDSQRFGHVLRKEFLAVFKAKKDFEGALNLYFKPNRNTDGKFVRDKKKELLANWDRFTTLKLDFPYFSSMQAMYNKTESWEKTFEVLPYSLREMFVTSFQSYIWNCELSKYIQSQTEAKPMHQKEYLLEAEWFIPVKSTILKVQSFDMLGQQSTLTLVQKEVLDRYGLTLDQYLSLSKLYRLNSVSRNIMCVPESFEYTLNDNGSILISFFLPRGSYATMLIKQLFL